MATDPNIYECAACGAAWEAPEGEEAPVVCPECGGACRIKPPCDPDQTKIKPEG